MVFRMTHRIYQTGNSCGVLAQPAGCPVIKALVASWLFLLPAFLAAFLIVAKADQIVYDDALENGWQDWGWATRSYTNASPVHSGSDSISVTAGAWQGLQIYHPDMDSTPYASIG